VVLVRTYHVCTYIHTYIRKLHGEHEWVGWWVDWMVGWTNQDVIHTYVRMYTCIYINKIIIKHIYL